MGEAKNENARTTCPADWIRQLAMCFRKVFNLNSGEVRLNDPFRGGYITKTHSKQKSWIQIEINRKLYLESPYFNESTLQVSAERIAELNEMIYQVLCRFCDLIDF